MTSNQAQTVTAQTFGDFLDRIASVHGQQTALVRGPVGQREVWSFARLREDALRVSARLRQQGVTKGDRVVLWAASGPRWVVAYFAALRLGAIVVPLDVSSSAGLVEGVVTQTAPKLAVVSGDTRAGWTFPIPTLPVEDLETLLPVPDDAPPPSVGPDDPAEIVFTSGTTGDPKGVILTHRNILFDVEACNRVLPAGPRFRPLSILPLSHMFEQTVGLLMPLSGGARVAYAVSRKPEALLQDMQEYQITTMLLVPRVLQLFMDAIEREVARQGREESWSRLQGLARHLPRPARRLMFRSVIRRFGGKLDFFVTGGAPLEPELERKWESLGIAILQGYGSTETAPAVTSTSLQDRKPRSVGKALPGVSIRLAADGEILVRGPNVTRGYWHDPEATQAAFVDGWYETGDLGELDAEGRLYLRSRKKDLIVLSNGEKVYPQDVEQELRRVAGVVDAVVVGMPTPQGPQVRAVLLLESPAVDAAAVVRGANSRLAPHQRARSFTVWTEPDFPRTDLKVKRHEVMNVLLAGGSSTTVATV